ncbi:dimethylaniline monooxygenase [Hyaloscypha variabilis F]|uniref:Dimethylaniline monooxygenase n=1 Tax=Hyaloscypha variabilis (strain UAMH 11265 / GT02V1 / F) TaxID=1149755 RepID=A0A2J6RR00_HYAVF|nr:dimethylaniline monooxygenase [Hyaloscypha variabilis F]
MVQPIRRVAVIGAGVSGVTAAAHLKAADVQVTLFERTNTSGGVWYVVFDPRVPPEPAYPSLIASVAETAYYEDAEDGNEEVVILHAPPGPCYELLTNNVPTGLMKITLNSWPPGTEQNVRHNILAEYIQDTAAKTGVNEVAHFNTKVEHVVKEGGHWKVQTSTLDAGKLEKTNRDWEFDAVIVATGHYHAPKVPDIPGLKDWKKKWPSRIQHSKRYRSARGFERKTVLLIGGSTSSTDIAKELGDIAKNIYQSTRGGLFDHPTSMLPPKAVRVSEIASFNLEQNSGSTLDDEPIPGTVTLVDGQVLTNIDRVIICTGYHCTFPFLSQYHRDSVPATDADETVLVTDGLQMHNLHKDIFYIPDPTLAFIGVPYYTATFSLFDFQAITVAAVFSGKAHLPTETEMRAEYNQRVQEKGFGRIFHSLRGKDVDYVNELLAWINPSIVAAGGEPVEGHTKEWKEQYAALREKFKALLGDQPKPDVEKQNVEVLSETAEAIEVH